MREMRNLVIHLVVMDQVMDDNDDGGQFTHKDISLRICVKVCPFNDGRSLVLYSTELLRTNRTEARGRSHCEVKPFVKGFKKVMIGRWWSLRAVANLMKKRLEVRHVVYAGVFLGR